MNSSVVGFCSNWEFLEKYKIVQFSKIFRFTFFHHLLLSDQWYIQLRSNSRRLKFRTYVAALPKPNHKVSWPFVIVVWGIGQLSEVIAKIGFKYISNFNLKRSIESEVTYSNQRPKSSSNKNCNPSPPICHFWIWYKFCHLQIWLSIRQVRSKAFYP